jgi:hypothetical protein
MRSERHEQRRGVADFFRRQQQQVTAGASRIIEAELQ